MFLGQPREIMATFLSGLGVSLVTREAVAGPTSDEAVADVERAAATPRVGFGDNWRVGDGVCSRVLLSLSFVSELKKRASKLGR